MEHTNLSHEQRNIWSSPWEMQRQFLLWDADVGGEREVQPVQDNDLHPWSQQWDIFRWPIQPNPNRCNSCSGVPAHHREEKHGHNNRNQEWRWQKIWNWFVNFREKSSWGHWLNKETQTRKIIIFPCSKICCLLISKSFQCPALSFTFAVLLCTATALHIPTFSCRIYSTRKMDSIEGEDTLQIWLQHYNPFFFFFTAKSLVGFLIIWVLTALQVLTMLHSTKRTTRVKQ